MAEAERVQPQVNRNRRLNGSTQIDISKRSCEGKRVQPQVNPEIDILRIASRSLAADADAGPLSLG